MWLYNNCCFVIFPLAPLNSPVTIIFRLVGPTRRYEQCRGSFSHVDRPIHAFDNTNINVADHFFFSHPCVLNQRVKTRLSSLVPCALELHLELRRFRSMGKYWNTKYRESALLLCRIYATIAYVRGNAVCHIPYEICRTGVLILSNILLTHTCVADAF